jgi:hypothetical protein
MCSTEDPKTEEPPTTTESEKTAQWKIWEDRRFWSNWSVGERFNFLLLIFTAVYSATSIFQYRLAKRSLRVTERAYIEVHDISLDPAIASVGPITMVIRVKNTGRTPATIFDINITPAFSHDTPDFSLPKIPSYAQGKGFNTAGLGLLPAGETNTNMSKATSLKGEIFGFNPKQIKDIETEKARFFVFGYVKYQDAFGDVHATGFCAFYDPILRLPGLGMFNGCRQTGYAYAY